MFKKIALGIATFFAIFVVLGGTKAAQIAKLIASGKAFVPPPESVTASPAKADQWEATISAVGNLVATRQVIVSPEIGGTVRSLAFDSGQVVQKGQLLLRLDTSVEEAQLESAIADAALAQTTLERTKRLSQTNASTQATLDAAEARAQKTKADVEALRGAIGRKTVRAPFAGRLGIRQVDLGAYVDPGAKLVSLQSINEMYVDFNVPQQRLGQLSPGTPVRLRSDSYPGRTWEGKIDTIDGAVDTVTRNVKVRAKFENPDEAMHPGMFVEVGVVLPKTESVLVVPSTSIFYSPAGNIVYVVETTEADGKTIAHQKAVEIGERRGDFIAIRGVTGRVSTEKINVATASEESWQPTLSAVGTLLATKQVTISTQLTGMIKKLAFESGNQVKTGQVLVELNTEIEQARVDSAKADAELAGLTFERTKRLYDTNAVAQAEVDTNHANEEQMQALVSNLRGVVDRKIIRAPFSGRLGIRQVELGQYVSPGTPLVTLQDLSKMFVDFSMPQQRITSLSQDQVVRIDSDAFPDRHWEGKITTVDATIDPVNRNVKVRASFDNNDETLRAGMLVDVSVLLSKHENVVVIPLSAVDFAPYGNSVFIVEDKEIDGKPAKVVKQVFVHLGEQRGARVAVNDGLSVGDVVATNNISRLHNGGTVTLDVDAAPSATPEVATVKAGDLIVTSGAFKLHEGSNVAIVDKLNPPATIAPKPEDS